MIDRRAVLGAAAGAVGIVAAIVGAVQDQAWPGVVAGVCALVAASCALDLALHLRHLAEAQDELASRSAHLEAASDQMAARAARFEAEALKTRAQVADAMRQEAARQPADRTEAAFRPAVDPVIEPVTGLFNEQFFMATLEKRVSAARRGLRPLGLALLEVVTDISSGHPRRSDPVVVAEALVETVREADTVSRLDDGRFALLLEDTPENGAIWTIERVRRQLSESHPGHTVWAGLSCYPSHAFEQESLVDQARSALIAAKEWHQDRIEVAITPDD